MIPNDLETRRKVIAYMIALCDEEVNSDRFTNWECNFISSIKDQFETKGNLTDIQCEKLEQIYNKL